MNMPAMQRDDETRAQVLNRLRRAEGQMRAVIAMIEDHRECRDVMTQLTAVAKAVDRAGFKILACEMRHCLTDGQQSTLSEEELEKLFLAMS